MAHIWSDPVDFTSDTDFTKVFLTRQEISQRVTWCLSETEARELAAALLKSADFVKTAREGKAAA